MKDIKQKAFTLVELLVVITILTILSVVAYQSFGGATDKAQNVTKKANLANLGSTLELFNTEKNFYPMPQSYSETNLWGYNSGTVASTSNIIKVNYNDQEILSIQTGSNDTYGGGVIYGTGAWAEKGKTPTQIGAKGVIGTNGSFNKKYLKEKIYDTQLGDIKLTGETDKKMIDYGIGKFVYAIYYKPVGANTLPSSWNPSNKGAYYTLYTTFKDIDGEGYKTFLKTNYSKDNFTTNINKLPEDLIGLKQDNLSDSSKTTEDDNQGIPYPIDDFAK